MSQSHSHTNQSHCRDPFDLSSAQIKTNIRKSLIVLLITVATMLVEIYYGYISGSMALLADGWHMGTHAAALGITYLTYKLATSKKLVANFNFGGGKIIYLGGFTSGLLLTAVVFSIAYETILRLIYPTEIHFNEALIVAVIGLIINLLSAYLLHEKGDSAHDHSHSHSHHSHSHDHNIRAAYIHVIADAITSVGAIMALLAAKYLAMNWLDPVIGLIGALIILKWSYGLLKDSAWELLDGHATGINFEKLKQRIEDEKVKILDLHVWRVAPHILNCELVIETSTPKGVQYFRNIIENEFSISHSVIEERTR